MFFKCEELLVAGQFLYFGSEKVKRNKYFDVSESERELKMEGCLGLGKDLVKLGLFQTIKNLIFPFS